MGSAVSLSKCCSSTSSSSIPGFDASNFEHLKDHSQQNVRQLIFHMDRLIAVLEKGEKSCEQLKVSISPSSKSPFTDAGTDMLQALSNSINWRIPKRLAVAALHTKTVKLVSDVLGKLESVPCVGIAASIVVSFMEQHDQFSSNKQQRLRLLKHMSALAKRMNDLHDVQQREKFVDIFAYVVKATVMCAQQMQPLCLCRFLFTYIDAEDLQDMEKELTDKYEDLKLDYLISIQSTVNSIKRSVPRVILPSTNVYCPSAVDIEDAVKMIKSKLDLGNSFMKVVVIYGLGGIGKTTLATQVAKELDLSSYSFCRLDMDIAFNNIQSLQGQLLRDAFGLNNAVDSHIIGQTMLSQAFKESSKPLFLFIDNALRKDELEKLLPIDTLSYLPSRSRILVTTRNLNEVRVLSKDLVLEEHNVHFISNYAKAKRLLCHFAFGNPEYLVTGADVHELLKLCQGIPLILRMAGLRLHTSVVKKGKEVSKACREITEFMSRVREQGWAERETDGIVDFVFTQLSRPSKDAFFDLIFFLWNWKRRHVAYYLGEAVLEELEEAALLTNKGNGRVHVHDIIRERGRVLSKKFEEEHGIRIIDRETWNSVKNDSKKLTNIKGIRLRDAVDMDIENINSCSKMQILMLEDCAMERVKLYLPDSLQLLVLDGLDGTEWDVHPPRISNLRWIKLSYINAGWFYQCMDTFRKLVCLKLVECSEANEVSEYPSRVSGLRELRELNVNGSGMLEKLLDYSTTLRNLTALVIKYCSIKKLPENFSSLSSLIFLQVTDCRELEEEALNILLQIQNLFFLRLEGSPKLIKGWERVRWQRRPLPSLSFHLTEALNQDGCLFAGGGGSGFFRVKRDEYELVWEDATSCPLMADGVKVCLINTGICYTLSEKCRNTLEGAIQDGYEIVYVDSGVSRWDRMKGPGDEVEWNEEDKRVMKKVLSQLPRGRSCRVWTSPFPKTCFSFVATLLSPELSKMFEPKETVVVGRHMKADRERGKVMMSSDWSFSYLEEVSEESLMEDEVRGIGCSPLGFPLSRQGLTSSFYSFLLESL